MSRNCAHANTLCLLHSSKRRTLFFLAASTIHFDGSQHLTLNDLGNSRSEAEDLTVRFRTTQKNAFLLATRHDASADKLEMVLGKCTIRHKQQS